MKGRLPVLPVTVVVSVVVGIVIGRQMVSDPVDRSVEREGFSSSRSSRHGASPNRARKDDFSLGAYRQNMDRVESQLIKMGEFPDSEDWQAFSFAVWQMVKVMSVGEVREALEEIKGWDLSKRATYVFQRQLFSRWAKLDGQGAVEYVLENKDENGRYLYLTTNTWMESDLPSMKGWYPSVKDALPHETQVSMEIRMYAALAKRDFSQAFEKAKASPLLRRKAMLMALGQSAVKDDKNFKVFGDYLAHLEDQELAQEVAASFFDVFGSGIDDERGRLFVESWPGEEKGRLIRGLTYQWAQKEPEKALDWMVGQLNDEDKANMSIPNALSNWARNDQEAAGRWLESHSDVDNDTIRGDMLPSLLYNNNFLNAAQWMSGIQDREARSRKYQVIYREWGKVDRDGADVWLGRLPEADQATVIELSQSLKKKN